MSESQSQNASQVSVVEYPDIVEFVDAVNAGDVEKGDLVDAQIENDDGEVEMVGGAVVNVADGKAARVRYDDKQTGELVMDADAGTMTAQVDEAVLPPDGHARPKTLGEVTHVTVTKRPNFE